MQSVTITSLPDTATDLRTRIVKYTIAMSVRMLCFGAMFVLRGWWLLIPVIAAVTLPYVAVVIANAKAPAHAGRVEAPTRELTEARVPR